MPNVFYNKAHEFHQYDIDENGNIIEQILDTRKKEVDSKRFYLNYISLEELSKYDFNNEESLKEFREDCTSLFDSPVKDMGGCNLHPDFLDRGVRDSGIILSDPKKVILGQFDVINDSMIYSPIFPFFYEERDLVKFAQDTYFTTIPFENLVMNQMNYVSYFYVHTRNAKSMEEIKKGKFVFEEISKDEMTDYLKNPEQGQRVLSKYISRL